MEVPQQQTLPAEEEATVVVSGEEATLVAPRFDDEETLVARPVVPLDGEAVEPPAAADATPAPTAAARLAYARSRYAPRRSWMVGLMLASVLVGGVLGGAGLYLYQRQSRDDAGGATPQAVTPADTAQPASAPDAGVENAPPPAAQP
ncbi:MAG TPA: hypothetical protein VF611_12360, partial [Pyrinomonadaceae bacterium]